LDFLVSQFEWDEDRNAIRGEKISAQENGVWIVYELLRMLQVDLQDFIQKVKPVLSSYVTKDIFSFVEDDLSNYPNPSVDETIEVYKLFHDNFREEVIPKIQYTDFLKKAALKGNLYKLELLTRFDEIDESYSDYYNIFP